MKVILRQDVENLGRIGDIVSVKDGYARNFLIPRSFAYLATKGAMNAIEVEKKRLAKKQAKEKAEAEIFATKLSEVQVSIPMKVGEEGKLFGSVTPQMVAQELVNKGHDIDKKAIVIDEPIRSLGVFDIKIKLHPEVFANVKVWVISEEEQAQD